MQIDKECCQFWTNIKEEVPYLEGRYLIFLPSRSLCRYWFATYKKGINKFNLNIEGGGYSGDTREHWIKDVTHYIHLEDPQDED